MRFRGLQRGTKDVRTRVLVMCFLITRPTEGCVLFDLRVRKVSHGDQGIR